MDNYKVSNSPGKVLEIKTVQIAPFRTLMTALKDILLETNITFQPDGIRIINMDKSHTILAHLFLDATKFEYFYCKYPKIVIGVNMFHLFKLINSIDNDDTLTIYIDEKDYSDGKILHLDGLSIYYDDWWFNLRPSNTEPLLRLNLESKVKSKMKEKRDELLKKIRS